jgi:hypothetical protein
MKKKKQDIYHTAIYHIMIRLADILRLAIKLYFQEPKDCSKAVGLLHSCRSQSD